MLFTVVVAVCAVCCHVVLQHCVCCFNTAPHYRGAAPGAQIGGCGGTPCGARAVGALVASARVPGCVSSPPWRVFCGTLLAVRAYRVHRAQQAVAFPSLPSLGSVVTGLGVSDRFGGVSWFVLAQT